jgi:hypothetical protein
VIALPKKHPLTLEFVRSIHGFAYLRNRQSASTMPAIEKYRLPQLSGAY